MLELTGIASVLRGTAVLYWLLAVVALFLAIKFPKERWKKAASTAVVLVLFGYLPVTQYVEAKQRENFAKEAWAYFKKKCETEAGQKIYKTFAGVKSVLVIRPLPHATDQDNYDQFWYGDPYSAPATSVRTELAASTLAWSDGPISRTERGRGFDFVESVIPSKDESKKFIKYFYPKGARNHSSEVVDQAVSRFGVSWEDISMPEDRKYWVAGSRLRVIDLADNSIVAERIGYFIEAGFGSTIGQRRPWLTSRGPNTTCPEAHDYADRWFILKALKPTEEKANGK